MVSSSSTVQSIHPLPFVETVFNNDVPIDLRDEDGAIFENLKIFLWKLEIVLVRIIF